MGSVETRKVSVVDVRAFGKEREKERSHCSQIYQDPLYYMDI